MTDFEAPAIKARERLIEAARNLFHERGYNRTSIEHILRASKVARSNFYYHFKGKRELAAAVFEAQVGRYRDKVLATTLKNPQLTALDRFNNFLAVMLDAQAHWGARRGSFFGNFAHEFGASDTQVRHAVATFYRALEYAVAECLADGTLNGVFRVDIEPQVLSRVVVAGLEGATLIAKAQNDLNFLTSVAEGLKKLVVSQ